MSDNEGLKLSRIALDIADLIDTGQFESDQLAVIEAACRKQRVTLGPAKRARGGESGRKRKRLRKPSADEVSAQLAAFAGTATHSRPGYVAPQSVEDANRAAFLRDFRPSDDPRYKDDFLWQGKFFTKSSLRARLEDKQFTMTGTIPNEMAGQQFEVLKVNRTRARCVLLDNYGSYTQTKYAIPFQMLLQSYYEGKFKP